MKCSHGDIWEFFDRGCYVVIPTNAGWKKNTFSTGMLNVMGRGLAWQAKQRYPDSAEWLGQEYFKLAQAKKPMGDPEWLKAYPGGRLIFLPTKPLNPSTPQLSWKQKSDPIMIEKHLEQLPAFVTKCKIEKVAIPLLGAGNGGLDPEKMKDLIFCKLEKDTRFTLVLPHADTDPQSNLPLGEAEDLEDQMIRLRPAKKPSAGSMFFKPHPKHKSW